MDKIRIEYTQDFGNLFHSAFEREGDLESAEDIAEAFRNAMAAFGFSEEAILEYMPFEFVDLDEYHKVCAERDDFEEKFLEKKKVYDETVKTLSEVLKDNAKLADQVRLDSFIEKNSHNYDYLVRIAKELDVEVKPECFYPIEEVLVKIHVLNGSEI